MIELAKTETPFTVASHYDDLDEFYRELWGLHVHHGLWESGNETSSEATENLIRHLISDLKLGPEKSVCDIGCGYGGTARYLSSHSGVRVTGLSVSGKQISVGNTLNGGLPVELLQRDWMDNGLPDESFDLALSIESSEHMPNLRKFFTEASRVLKPDGTFRICAWLSSEDAGKIENAVLLKPVCREGRIRLGTIPEYKEHLREAGFSEITFEDLTDQVKRTWTLCLGRFAVKLFTDPKYLGFLLKNPSRNKNFLFSLLRIRIAYELKSMRYGVFTGVKLKEQFQHS